MPTLSTLFPAPDCYLARPSLMLLCILASSTVFAQTQPTPVPPARVALVQGTAARIQLIETLIRDNEIASERFRFLTLPPSGAVATQDAATLMLATEPAPVMLLSASVTSGADTRFPLTFSLNPFRAIGVSDLAAPSLAQSALKVAYAPLVIKNRVPGQTQQMAGSKTGSVEYSIKFTQPSKARPAVSELKAFLAEMDNCLQRDCPESELFQLITRGDTLFRDVERAAADRRSSLGLSAVYGWDTSAGADTVVLSATGSRSNFGQIVNGYVVNPTTLGITGSWTRFQGIEQQRVSVISAADRQLRDGLTLRVETRLDRYSGYDFLKVPGRTDASTKDWGLSESFNFTILNDKTKKLSLAFKQLHVGSPDLEFTVGFSYTAQLGSQ